MRRFLALLTSLIFIFIVSLTSFIHEKSPPNSALNTYLIAFKSKKDSNVIKNHGGEMNRLYKIIQVICRKSPEKSENSILQILI